MTSVALPPERSGVQRMLQGAVRSIIGTAGQVDRIEAAGRDLAKLVVSAGMTTPTQLREIMEQISQLGDELQVSVTDPAALDQFRAALVAEHVTLTQRRLLRQQEAIHRAVLAARAEAESRRKASEARFSALFADAPVGIGIGDVAGNILQINEALQCMFGYTAEEMATRDVQSFMHPDDAPQVWQYYRELTSGQRDSFRTEKRYLSKDGAAIWTDLSVSLIRDERGTPTHQIAVLQDVTERHQLEERLRHAATHDALTGLPNRAMFMNHLESAIRTTPPDSVLTLCFLDIDDFKMLNDTRGHLTGDQVLIGIAQRLQPAAAEAGGVLARLGGDEFVVLAGPGSDAGAQVDLATRLLDALATPVVVQGSSPVDVRASIGMVELPAGGATAESLLQAADLARRAAKEDGKGRVVLHDPMRSAVQLKRVEIALSLPGVVERGELGCVYQPLTRLDDNTLHSMELLLRWQHPELGNLRPDDFIPIAEESGDIAAIGDWVLAKACHDLAENPQWPAININVSVQQLYRPTLVEEVQRWLTKAGVAPDRLRIEITETAIVRPTDPVPMRVLRQLSRLGIRLALDDFGTGYANVAALRRLPLAELKLASSFVGKPDHIPDDTDRRILRAIVELAHELNIVVIVEGIETAAQHEWVRSTGCDVGQGYFYDTF